MNRVLAVVIVVGLAVVAYFMPVPLAPEPGPPSAVDPPAVAVCAVEEGSGRQTTVGVVSTANGVGLFTAFAGGTSAGSTEFFTGASGSTSIDVHEVAAVGVAAGLVEPPSADTATASVVKGAESLSAEGCASMPARITVLAGGSTLSGRTFEVQLMNPYSGRAIVDLVVQSEAGLESSGELEAVIVPPRSSIIVDLGDILPGREVLNVVIETTTGSVLAVGRFGETGDSAVWRAVEPAQEWFLPVAHGLGARSVLIANASAVDVEYELDFYSPDGVEEAQLSEVIPARGVAVIDIGAITSAPAAVHVVATGPIAGFVRMQEAWSTSLTSGATVPASRWLLPGAGSIEGGFGSVVVFNPGIEEANFTLTARRGRSEAVNLTVQAGEILEVEAFETQAHGYVVDGDRPLVVMWTISDGFVSAASIGTPLEDG